MQIKQNSLVFPFAIKLCITPPLCGKSSNWISLAPDTIAVHQQKRFTQLHCEMLNLHLNFIFSDFTSRWKASRKFLFCFRRACFVGFRSLIALIYFSISTFRWKRMQLVLVSWLISNRNQHLCSHSENLIFHSDACSNRSAPEHTQPMLFPLSISVNRVNEETSWARILPFPAAVDLRDKRKLLMQHARLLRSLLIRLSHPNFR